MANINLGIGSRKIASVAERHTTVPATTYQLAGGIATVERCPLLCNLGSNQFLLVTQGSRDNAFDYSYNCIIGRLGTWATDSNGDTYVSSLGDPYEIFNLSTYTEGTAWLNIGSLTAKPLVGATHTGRIILCFTIYDSSTNNGAITRSYACKTYSDSATGAAGTWSSVTKATYSGGYTGGTGDISASVIKVSNATPAGQLTCYTGGTNSRNSDWEHYAFGPGNIVELSNGTLVAFANHRYKVTSATTEDKIPYTHCIYSTDGGDTWALGGGFVENAADANAYTNEVAAVLKNVSDHIFISCRITSSAIGANYQHKRATTTVTNHAANWSTPTVTTDIGGNDCEAALTSASVGGNLYCTQVSNANTSVTGNRTCLGLWKSTDGGTSWTFTNMIDGGWVAYSAVMCMDGTNFITVWERNRDINEVASFVQQIGICGYNKTWADSTTNVRTLTYYFNEATSGAIPTTGHPLKLQGDMYGGGYGGAQGTYSATGISCTGTGVGAVLATVSPSNLAPWQFGGQFDPGLEAFTVNFIGANVTGTVGTTKAVVSNMATISTGQGWCLKTGVGATLSRFVFQIADGTNFAMKTLGVNSATNGKKSIVVSVSAAPTRSIRAWVDDGAGTWTESGTATTASSVTLQVKGVNALTVGSLPDGSAGTGFDLDGLVFTRGAALTDTTAFLHSGNFTKTTWDTYNGSSGYIANANSPETVYGSGCKTHLMPNIDQGYSCKVDLYGYYPGTHATIRPGDPVQTVMDVATPTRKWTTASNNRGLVWANDSTLGNCLRMQYVSASGNGYLTCPASADFDFNVTGVFTLCFPMIQFNAETGGTQMVWDQISGSAANSGLYMGRVDTTGKVFVILSDGAGGSLISDATFGVGAPAIAVGNTYFIALVGKGPAVKPSLVVGQWTSSTQTPTLTSYDATAVMASLNGSPAATLAPYIGALAGGGSGGANIRLLRDIFVTNTSASLVQLGKNAEYALNAGGVALRGGGLSLGLDLGI